MNCPPLKSILSSYVFWIVLVGLTTRLVLGVFFTYPYDSSSWARIAESSLAGTALYDRPDNYYAPIWGYVLSFLAMVYTSFGGISFGRQFDELLFLDNFTFSYYGSLIIDPAFAFLVRMFLIAVDIAVAFTICKIVLNLSGNERRADIAMAIWFLCPLTIYSSSVYLIFDTLEVLFLVLCLYFALNNRPFIAGIMMFLAGMTKPFAFYLIPLLVVWFMTRSPSRTEKVNGIALAMGGFAAAFMLTFPFVLLSGDFDAAFVFLTGRVDAAGESTLYGWEYIISVFTTFKSQGFIWLQPVIIGATVLFAILFAKKGERTFRRLLFYSVMTMIVVFAWPVAQQCYYLVLIMLIALLAAYWDPRYVAGLMLVLSVPSLICQVIAHNYSLILPFSAYTGIVPLDWAVEKFVTFNTAHWHGMNIYTTSRLVMQWMILASMLFISNSLYRRRYDETC